MTTVRLEINRHGTMDQPMWELRGESELPGTADEVTDLMASSLPSYCIKYHHRVFIDGALRLLGTPAGTTRGQRRGATVTRV